MQRRLSPEIKQDNLDRQGNKIGTRLRQVAWVLLGLARSLLLGRLTVEACTGAFG